MSATHRDDDNGTVWFGELNETPHFRPDREVWRRKAVAPLWQVVWASLNLTPVFHVFDQAERDVVLNPRVRERSPLLDDLEGMTASADRRLEIAISHVLGGSLAVLPDVAALPAERLVDLSVFGDWARQLGMALPDWWPLRDLPPTVPSERPSRESKPRRDKRMEAEYDALRGAGKTDTEACADLAKRFDLAPRSISNLMRARKARPR